MYTIKIAVVIDAVSFYDKIVYYVLPVEHKSAVRGVADSGIFVRVH